MRWHSSHAFEKRQKKKLFGENNFLHLAFLAPGENYCESAKKFFSSQKHATRENFMRRLQHRLAFLHSAAFPELLFIDGCIFFSFMIHFDFHNFSLHIFSFHFFSFLLFSPCDDDVSHTSARLRLTKHTLPLCFFIPSELLACATNFAPFGRRPIIGRISVCMLVPARRCYATSNTRSIIKHENSPLLRLSDRSSHMHVEEAKKYLHTVQSLTSIHSSWTRRVVASVENK